MFSARLVPLFPLFSFLKPKGVTEALHQGATGKYVIGPLVTVNPLIFIRVVTVLIF